MAKKKHKQTPATIRAKHKREDMVEQGVYDGRYRPRVIKDKSKYTRKDKPKGDDEQE
jgi:hypothetical protein